MTAKSCRTNAGGMPASRGLLGRYRAHDLAFFASEQRSLLLQPRHAVDFVRLPADEGLAEQVRARLCAQEQRLGAGALAVGCLPFEDDQSASLWFADRPLSRPFRSLGTATGIRAAGASPMFSPERVRTFYPGLTPDQYRAAVHDALCRIERGELHKVVLARSLGLRLDVELDQTRFLRLLAEQCAAAFLAAFSLPAQDERESCTLMAASPELLLHKVGHVVLTNPLAGSRPRSADPRHDRALYEELLRSPKDLHEHALVTQAVVEALRPYCAALRMPAAPGIVGTSTMWHLSTRIEGRLRDRRCSSLSLLRALHPTPAVCGAPRERAREVIARLEKVPRGPFAGAVGYCDSRGDGEWALTLRCVQVKKRELLLHAGAGIVAGSCPEAELQETSHKLSTLLRVLGLSELLEVAA